MTSVGSQHDAAAAAALKGASLAFQKKPAPPPPPKKDNGALTAATSAEQSSSAARGTPRPSGPQSSASGSSISATPETPQNHHDANDRLMPTRAMGIGSSPLQTVKVDTKSPSFIAATLAASRSASPSPKPRGVGRVQSGNSGTAPASPADAVDSIPIAPTGSLISMFERGGAEGDPVKQRSPRRSPTRVPETNPDKQRVQPETKTAPVPQSSSLPAVKMNHSVPKEKPDVKPAALRDAPVTKPKPKPTPAPISRPSTPPSIIHRSSPELVSPKSRRATKPILASVTPQPTPPQVPRASKPAEPPVPKQTIGTKPSLPSIPPKATPNQESKGPKPPDPTTLRTNKTTKPTLTPVQLKPVSRETPREASLAEMHPQKKDVQQVPRPPTPPKPRRSKTGGPAQAEDGRRRRADSEGYFPPPRAAPKPSRTVERPASPDSDSSDDTFVSASSGQSPLRSSPPALPMRRRTIASAPSSPVRETPPSHRARPMRNFNASTSTLPLESLTTAIVAGSLASANLTPHHSGSTLPAPPLPKRQKSPRLLQTLRQPHVASDDESDKHKKSHLRKFRGGKHSHHEGSRKRWREEITERERKRYEAVWASNRGLLLTSQNTQAANNVTNDTSQCVANIVVREIWKRSRLPQDELAEVWDLVDRKRRGMLNRQEFVVGMWLIDQRLRGRKIPHRVSDSVWGSANGVHVIKPKVK